MKILLLTDSLGLPRFNPEVCLLEKTWPYLLKAENYDVLQCSIGGATSYELYNQSKYYKACPCNAVIIQVGIVDCVPRFVGILEKEIIKKIPYVGGKILGVLNSKIVRKVRNMSYVSSGDFEKNLLKLINNFPKSTQFYFVEIIGGVDYEKKLEGVSIKIFEYNQILKSLPNSTLIQFSTDNITMSDYHHLNEKGHENLYKMINQALSSEKKLKK